MRKSEIVQIALVILGITIIVEVFSSMLNQLIMLSKLPKDNQSETYLIIIAIGVILLILFIGIIIIWKSKAISQMIFKRDDETNSIVSLTKFDILHLSVTVLCLYFIIRLFPSFLSSFSTLVDTFLDDFPGFKKMIISSIGAIFLYIVIVITFLNSGQFSKWLDKRM